MNGYIRALLYIIIICISLTECVIAQESPNEDDAFIIRAIYDEALTNSSAYSWLTHLSETIGGRLSGSPESYEGVEYTASELLKLGVDRSYLQECTVPRWKRQGPEKVMMHTKNGNVEELTSTTLGNSTGGKVKGEVVLFTKVDDVRALEANALTGKIVFFNRPMNSKHIRTFHAYGGAVDQRGSGPAEAARKGAIGCIVRSMTTEIDDVPHTGVTIFKEGDPTIPAMAISTMEAELLAKTMEEGPVEISMENHCKLLPDTLSYNVVGEIKGSQYPDEIIVVGGHLDSWDLGGGAQDDGAGCVQAMTVIEILKNIDYIPKRTIRCVMFMNEENGLGGGRAYADSSNANGEFHIAALESDSGGFSPRGFSADGHNDVRKLYFRQISKWLPLLEPYGLRLTTGGSGADISPLKSQKGLLLGLRTDSQRYFDFHHTANDRIEAVNKRELELGAAAMTAMVYLIDQHGIDIGEE